MKLDFGVLVFSVPFSSEAVSRWLICKSSRPERARRERKSEIWLELERERGKGVRERSGFLRVYQSEDVGCYQENHHERHCVEKPWPQRR